MFKKKNPILITLQVNHIGGELKTSLVRTPQIHFSEMGLLVLS